MKRVITLLGLLAGVSSVANAETLWVYGVNEHGGWYDANKDKEVSNNNMCWAAVSSNLINWWQSQYDVSNASYRYIPKGDEVWAKYNNYVLDPNEVGDIRMGLEWWLSGNGWGYFKDNNGWSYGGFYEKYVEDNDIYYDELYVRFVEGNATQLTNYLRDTLRSESSRQGIGLNIVGHGITLWGVEFTDPQTIEAVWVTDSDDVYTSAGDRGLFRVSVVYNTDGTMSLAGPSSEDGYYKGETRIDSFTIIDAVQTDAWGMPRIELTPPVPEPTTATLSLLALAGVAARRRRR